MLDVDTCASVMYDDPMKKPALQLGMSAHHGGRFYAFWSSRDGLWHLQDTEYSQERTYTSRDTCVRALWQNAALCHFEPITAQDAQRRD